MIQKLDSAISDIQNDLNSYKKADQAVRAEGSHLDETQLMQKLENTKKLIQLIEQKIEEDKKVVQKFMSSGFEGVAKGLAELPGLDGQLDNLKSLKRDYEKKLIALQTFSVSTSSLFSDSLHAFKFALQGVDVINQSRASVDGTITFPVGSNMNWLENLKSEKLSSKLKSYDKKLKKYVGQPEVLKSIEQLSEDKGISFSKAESLYNSMQKLKERKYIKPSDKIITTINSFSVSGMNVVYTEVKNVNYIQIMCLVALYIQNGLTQEKIIEDIGVDKASVNRAIKALENNNFITRKRNESDKRAFNLYLTTKAFEFKEVSWDILSNWELMISEGIEEEEKAIAFKVMKKMSLNADKIYKGKWKNEK